MKNPWKLIIISSREEGLQEFVNNMQLEPGEFHVLPESPNSPHEFKALFYGPRFPDCNLVGMSPAKLLQATMGKFLPVLHLDSTLYQIGEETADLKEAQARCRALKPQHHVQVYDSQGNRCM
jgi:hypothetical protein